MLKPAKSIEWLDTVSHAWASNSPEKSFFGLTLAQYRDGVKPSYDIRVEIAETQKRLKGLLAKRDDADAASFKLTQSIVQAVKADPTEGENSPLYAAMGYVRKSERSSGLTRARARNGAAKEEETTA
jgi:hypothetical protein